VERNEEDGVRILFGIILIAGSSAIFMKMLTHSFRLAIVAYFVVAFLITGIMMLREGSRD
jgi:hypothetical protein